MSFKTKGQKFYWAAVLLAGAVYLASCANSPSQPTRSANPTLRTGALTPFTFASPTLDQAAPDLTTTTPLPSITPTPRTHIVKKGEDMFGIAYRYGITLDELKGANPEVNPNAMSVGMSLVIPGTAPPPPASEIASTPPTPTAVPITSGSLYCARTQDGGAWCSLPVLNTQEYPVEGLTAVFHLTDTATLETTSQAAFLPLDVLLPGKTLPLSAYFPAPIPNSFQASAEIQSAFPNREDGRYLPVQIENQDVFLSEDGLFADIRLTIRLETDDSTANRVWIAAVAYDQQGNAVGLRRWEMPEGQPLTSGESREAVIHVYSSGPGIEKVDLAAEARP